MVTQEEINEYFMEAIRYLKAQGNSQKDIVLKARLGQNAISKIKKGESNAGDETIRKLAQAFRLNVDFFYGKSTYITLLDKSSANLDNSIEEAKRFLSGTESQKNESHPEIDFSSYINALLAKSDETIASMKRELAAKDEIIAAKDERIADLTKLAEERLHRIAELRRVIDASNLSEFPFTIGSAEDSKSERKRI